MSPGRAADFAPLAVRYDELRPADSAWWAAIRLLVREGDLVGRTVLDVGCGTGRLVEALATRYDCRVAGVDPTPEMLDVARKRAPPDVTLETARAEELPFADEAFERVVMTLVVHLLDRPRAFAEIARVLTPGGRLAFLTFDPAYFPSYYLNRYFPSMLAADTERFAPPGVLTTELEQADFAAVRFRRSRRRTSIPRAQALEKIRGRHISTFQLIPDAEYRAGLERAERELPARVDYELRWLVVVAER